MSGSIITGDAVINGTIQLNLSTRKCATCLFGVNSSTDRQQGCHRVALKKPCHKRLILAFLIDAVLCDAGTLD